MLLEVVLESFTGYNAPSSSQLTFSVGSTQMGALPFHLSPRHSFIRFVSPYRQLASGTTGIEEQSQAQDKNYWWVKLFKSNQ